MKKKPRYEDEENNIPEYKSDLYTIVCPMCKDSVVFINGQESKTCPFCGTIVQPKNKFKKND
jgi:ribosomal protein S27E